MDEDIVWRLRSYVGSSRLPDNVCMDALSAAAEIVRLRAENAKMWGALEAQEKQSQRGLFNMTSEEIEHVHKLRRAILNRNASEGEK